MNVKAAYASGVLKPKEPLLLNEHEDCACFAVGGSNEVIGRRVKTRRAQLSLVTMSKVIG